MHETPAIRINLGLSPNDVNKIINDDFSDNDRVHNWRTHIPDEIVEMWESLLSPDSKLIAYYMARRIAENEVWN